MTLTLDGLPVNNFVPTDGLTSPILHDSRYITEDKLREFFQFDDPSAINLLHINCRSLRKNFDNIRLLLSTIKYPLTAFAISETWLNNTQSDVYNIPGYNFVSQPRSAKIGGGVGIYVDSRLDFKTRSDISRLSSHIECLFIEIKQLHKVNILIGCIYRPPGSDVSMFNSDMLSILKSIDEETKKITLLAGDYNLDLLKHDTHLPTGVFLNNMLSHSLFPTIRHPTRISDKSSTLLDNIFVNCIKYELQSAILYNDISDHLPVAIHLKTTLVRKRESNSLVRLYSESSITKFNDYLKDVDWTYLYDLMDNTDDASGAYDYFLSVYATAFDVHFPMRNLKVSNRMTPRNDWMTKGLMKSCIKKSKLYRTYRKGGTIAQRDKYITYRNRLKKLLHIAEKNFYFDKLRLFRGNVRQTWKVIGSVLNQKKMSEMSESFKIDGINVTCASTIVEKFNEYFANIGCNLAAKIPNSLTSFKDYLTGQSHPNSFFLYPTSHYEITNIVKQFKSKGSHGVDGIPVHVLKATVKNIAEPLSKLINCSFSSGVVPLKLKIGKICPIYKDGDKDLFSNYRPISVLSSFSKIYEKAVFIRLLSFLNSNNILSEAQYGFQQNHSTYMALLDMYESISLAIDKKEYSIGVFIDLSKAFDTLNHKILLQKLEYYGIRGLPLKWFESYLSETAVCLY